MCSESAKATALHQDSGSCSLILLSEIQTYITPLEAVIQDSYMTGVEDCEWEEDNASRQTEGSRYDRTSEQMTMER